MQEPFRRYTLLAALAAAIGVIFFAFKSYSDHQDVKRRQERVEADLVKLRKARKKLDSLTELYGSTPRRDLATVVIPELINLRDQIGEIPTPETPPCLSDVSTRLRQTTEKTLESVKAFADISYDLDSIETSAIVAESRSSLYLQEARSIRSEADDELERSTSTEISKYTALCYKTKK